MVLQHKAQCVVHRQVEFLDFPDHAGGDPDAAVHESGKFAAEAHAGTEREEIKQLRIAARPPNPSDALVIAMARGEMLLEE